MERLPLVSFVVPVRNDAGHLRACLASIAADAAAAGRFEILVADNGSTDASRDVARAAGALVFEWPGLTVAEMRNRAAQEARGAVLAFVDADHEIARGWTRGAIDALQKPGVVAAGAPYDAPRDGTWVQRLYNTLRDHSEGTSDVEWIAGGNLAVWREAFLTVGGFDTSLVTCEDVDLCQRLRGKGGRLLQDARMRTTHFGDPATLEALFFGELWRGRDNLRAGFRTPVTLRGLPSLVIPVADLALMVAGAAGMLGAAYGGFTIAALSLGAIAALAALRAIVMASRLPSLSFADAAGAFAVALTYDVARALAPLWGAPHAARRRAERR
jgi:hypothetical protein